MTYEDILNWAEENYPPQNYDSFIEWLNDVENDFASQSHFFPDQVRVMMEDRWNQLFEKKELEPVTAETLEDIREREFLEDVSRIPSEPPEMPREPAKRDSLLRRIFRFLRLRRFG